MKIFDKLNTLTAGYLNKFTSQVDTPEYVLVTPSFIINKSSYLNAAKDYIQDRLLARFVHLEGALENLSNNKNLSSEQMGQMIVVKRALSQESTIDFLAVPQLAGIAKQQAIVKGFNGELMNSTIKCDKHAIREDVKNESDIQNLAATFILLQKLHPSSAAMIRSSLYNPPMGKPVVCDSIVELSRNPTIPVLKAIDKCQPGFLNTYYPEYAKKLDNTHALTGHHATLSSRDRTADFEGWTCAPPLKSKPSRKI